MLNVRLRRLLPLVLATIIVVFQLDFTNTFGTTFAQIARGASPRSLWLGFNLSRTFY